VKTAKRYVLRVTGCLLGVVVIASMQLTAPANAAGTKSSCADAPYPSLAWTTCEVSNVAVAAQNPLGHLDLLPGITAATTKYQLARLQAIAKDPERQPNPNSCTTIVLCPIDPRVQNWTSLGGLEAPVLYTSRSGATMSGHVWATKTGPASRPGVIVINGSIIGFEEGYWGLAQALARQGFVVMTFDVQGEGMSDQFGEAPDQLEDAFAATPGLSLLSAKGSTTGPLGLGGNGLTFYDGSQDALDFFLSTPSKPFVPRPSSTTKTSHADKQTRRVAAGLDNGFNPLWKMLDRSKIGLTGHSYGAQATSWLAQKDPRVSAGVALDNVCIPASPAPDEVTSLTAPNPDFGGTPSILYGFQPACFATPAGPAPQITKPVLGITSDYLLEPTPYLTPPNPLGKSRGSLAYSKAGVDTGQIVVRGGSHYEFGDVPVVFPGSLRGIDLAYWYTTAWFDKYLKGDPAADSRLLTRRWLDDQGVNKLSWHFRSRIDIHTSTGKKVECEDLRTGCSVMVPKASDGWSGEYDFVTAAARNE
jgi:dienelactone hydrolase